MISSSRKRVPLAILLALASLSVNAAGLGRLTVLSGLGEPFSAEIEVFGGADELSSLSARIAPQEDYAAQGYDRPSVLDSIKINLGKRADGSSVLKLDSGVPIEDPFMELVVQMDWKSGRLSREYNALLDPPGFGERTVAKALPVVPENKTASLPPKSVKAVQPQNTEVTGGAGTSMPQNGTSPSDTYVTKRGDTLRQIAVKVKLDDVSLEDVTVEQVLVGVYQANTSAFSGGNINRLKVGQTLQIPAAEQLQTVSQEDAVKEIRLQTANWSAYRNRLAAMAARSTAQKSGTTSVAKARASVGDDKKQLANETRYILKVSPGDIEYSVGKQDGKKSPPKKLSSGN